uniref:Protein PNS1 n=1 Tax=Schizophyllum commune (strain H4-8 / FGSC 9210) TaxID=578458 RepID=D8PUV7_SCHCM
MTASFAAYASQFLTRQPQQASMASSQPLFFSFTTDGGGELDDLDDPHLRGAGSSTRHDRSGEAGRHSRSEEPVSDEDEDDDGPYLRLDEGTKPAGPLARSICQTPAIYPADGEIRPVLAATEAFVPAALTICSIWAFAGSFVTEDGVEPTWGETVGLRLFALIPLVFAVITGRRLLRGLPRRLHAASATLSLVTDVLFGELARPFVAGGEPYLLALSPALLLAALLASIPFATVVFRLLLVGYFKKEDSGYAWNVKGWARWALVGAIATWLWTWAVARGILRMTAAGVVGAWYFAGAEAPRHRPTDTHTIHAALFRATQTSLGTVCLAGAILSSLRALALISALLSRLPPWLTLGAMSTHPVANMLKPVALMAASGIAWAVRWLETVGEGVGGDALVYAGLTGEPFWKAAGRSAALAGPVGSTTGPSGGQPLQERGWGWARRQRRNGFGDAPLALLTLAPLTLCLPFALGAYMFTAHTLGAPNEAFGAAILVGSVAGLVGRFSIGVVVDCADTLYLCYCIDKDAGQKRRPEVFALFESLEREPRPDAPARQRPEEAQLFLGGQPSQPSSGRPARPSRQEQQLFDPMQEGQEEQLFGGRGQETVGQETRTHPSHPSQGSAGRAPLPLEGSEFPVDRSPRNERRASGRQARARSPSVDDEEMEPASGYDLRDTGRGEGRPHGGASEKPAPESEEDIDPFHNSLHDELPGEMEDESGLGGVGSGQSTVEASRRSDFDASRRASGSGRFGVDASRRESGSGHLTSSAQQKMSASRASMSDASVDDEPGSQFFPGSGFF